MDNIDSIKVKLDHELLNTDSNLGIKFSVELYEEFRQRHWFTLENFGVLGTNFLSSKVPAYNKTHFVFPSWDLEGFEYEIGKNT